MEQATISPRAADTTGGQASSDVRLAMRTVNRHALKSGLGNTPEEHAAFAGAWAASQLNLLLPYLERHAGAAETALASLEEGELRQALGIVLRNAADRCAVLSRDLDLARGDTLGTPAPEWSDRTGKPAMVRRVRESRTGAITGATKSL